MNARGVIAGAIAFLSCLTLLPAIKVISARYRLFDSPGPLKIHARPLSRLGGVAIAISVAFGISLGGGVDFAANGTFFAALLLIWITGLADDIWGLSPVFRLTAQIAAGSTLWLGGLRIPEHGGGVSGLVGICLIVIIFVNAFNFMDGSDGVLAGVAAIIAITFLLQFHGSQFMFSIQIAWAVAGSCLGFLFFNYSPASIFMGDSGSTVLGFVAAFLALNLYRAQEPAPLACSAAFLPAGLPLIDAALAILRRIRGNISPLYGDRRHVYDLLAARRWPTRNVALACYGITGIFCLAGWLATRCTCAWGFAISTITVGVFLVLEWRLGALQIPKPHISIPEATVLRLPNLPGNTKWPST